LRRSDCFRPSDQLAGWDSHPLEIADFHGVVGCPRILNAADRLKFRDHQGHEMAIWQ
jgi:hypothetical protein